MRDDDDDQVDQNGDSPAKPTRDARGRWLKGHCPNPRGRPRKKVQADYHQGDIRHFGNTLIDVAANGRVETMDRRTALNHKMFESAMKGRVSMQRFLYKEFERNDERLVAARLRHEQLLTEWVIKNPDFDGLDGESIPFEVQVEILGLESLLNHYFPNEYRKPPQPVRGKNPDGDDD